jgi:hypothetical protein
MKRFQLKFSKALIALCVVVILGAGVLTAVQTAYAFTIPPGCWRVEHSTSCKACGFLWLWEKNKEYWKWRCPNGGGGSHTEYGVCDDCTW